MKLKERIIEESSKLFFHNGIRSITMSDIAQNLGISKRTLYETFTDKEELLEACLKSSMAEADKELDILIKESDNVIDTMLKIYAKHLHDVRKINKSTIHDLRKYHPKLYTIIEKKQKEGVDVFVPLLEKGLEQGFIRDDIEFEVLVWILKGQFKMVMEGDFIPTEKYPIEKFVQAIILTFCRGISTAKGQEKIDELISKINN